MRTFVSFGGAAGGGDLRALHACAGELAVVDAPSAAWSIVRAVTEQDLRIERLGGSAIVDELRAAARGDRDALARSLALAVRTADALPDAESRLRLFAAVSDAAREIVSVSPALPTPARVVRIDDGAYALRCAACGQASAVMVQGADTWTYSGLATVLRLSPAQASLVLGAQLAQVHTLLKDGLDAYCPECDATYCGVHYHAQRFFDYGMSEGIRGVCPRGHERDLYVAYWISDRDD